MSAVASEAAIERVRSLSGQWLRREGHQREATRPGIARWSRAIGDRNPLWLNEGAARRSILAGIVAPPCWLYSVDDTAVAPGLPGLHSIYGGVSFEFYRWVRLGEQVRSRGRLVDVKETEGRFAGPMVIQSGQTEFHSGNGDIVARAQSTVLRTSRDAARERGKYSERSTRYRYSPEELLAVEDAYDQEEFRGDTPRYFEDVQEGVEITPLVRGPLTSEDMLQFISATGPVKAFSRFYEYRKRHPEVAFRDPETGAWETWEASMLIDDVARRFGFPMAHDAGVDRISWLGNLLTNWIGNDGFLSRLDVKLLLPNFYGDVAWCKGKVVRKSQTKEASVVDLEIWSENELGERTADGSAVVHLPSRGLS